MTQPVDDLERAAREREAEQAKLYGQFVAVEPIYIDGALAFNVGDPVPATHISRGVVDESQVARTTTKAGKAATGQEG